jgi:hypothetical protein
MCCCRVLAFLKAGDLLVQNLKKVSMSVLEPTSAASTLRRSLVEFERWLLALTCPLSFQ